MSENVIRVLNITRVFQAAGIESFIMNMYRNIDKNEIQFDFLVMNEKFDCYADEISSYGGRRYNIDIKIKNTFLRILIECFALYKFLKNNEYKIVHMHYTTPLHALYLYAAKMAGVPVRIYHSHSAEVSGKSSFKLYIYKLCRKKITKWATNYFACSKAAAKWMFESEIIESGQSQVICNGIDTEKFEFNIEKRKYLRKEFNIEDDYVLIHTGRFTEQKNQKFIIEIFKTLKSKCNNVKLILVGTGKLVDEVIELIEKYQLVSDVFLLGVRDDVEDLLSMADCYIMPSLYEGLPVAAVEAQCSGLPCILSKNITSEIKLINEVQFFSLSDDTDIWCDGILSYKNATRKEQKDIIKEKGYSIQEGAKNLLSFYQKVQSSI
ncbi:MAG: glycosyltransferase family 1 protein [Lachnospiraceae bacterium]|nr:glycosyltransferase family 1 protein [Lachnospiraceae bacterium]